MQKLTLLIAVPSFAFLGEHGPQLLLQLRAAVGLLCMSHVASQRKVCEVEQPHLFNETLFRMDLNSKQISVASGFISFGWDLSGLVSVTLTRSYPHHGQLT